MKKNIININWSLLTTILLSIGLLLLAIGAVIQAKQISRLETAVINLKNAVIATDMLATTTMQDVYELSSRVDGLTTGDID